MQQEKFRLRIYLIIFLLVLLGSSVLVSTLEDISLFDAFYYCIVTVSTVGYGDISAHTTAGRIITLVLIISGVGTFLGVIGNATEMFVNREEHKKLDRKINILLGLLFSEIGNKLLVIIQAHDKHINSTKEVLQFGVSYQPKNYKRIKKRIDNLKIDYKIEECEFKRIYALISTNKEFLMRMLENPMLLEGEKLTELIRDIFHLYEEFTYRLKIENLSKTDILHLNQDVIKVYKGLLSTWVLYMEYLHSTYPNLHKFNTHEGPLGEIKQRI